MDTSTRIDGPEHEAVDPAPTASRRSRGRRLGAAALVVASVVATLGLTTGTASAASFFTPTLDCIQDYGRLGQVRVDPGVRSWYGTSDGYYRVTLYRYNSAGWQQVRTAQGRTSYNQMVIRDGVGFANLGSGYYAARVERWNAQNGRWVRLTPVAAQTVNPYSQRTTGWTVCQLR